VVSQLITYVDPDTLHLLLLQIAYEGLWVHDSIGSYLMQVILEELIAVDDEEEGDNGIYS
jgi:hypothetical protein